MRLLAAILTTVLFLALPLLAADPPPLASSDSRVAALGDADEKARRDAHDQLVQAGAVAVPALLVTMNGENVTAGKMAYDALFHIAQQAAGTPQQGRIATLVSQGIDAKNKVSSRRSVCRLLSFIGGNKESVEALTAALSDTEIGEMARWALIRIPGERATQALAGRLKAAEPQEKLALIDALAARRDERVVSALIAQTAADDEALKTAAWNALAHIPSRDSMDHFHAAVTQKKDPLAHAALLDYAATLSETGLLQQAGDVLELRTAAGPLSPIERCRAIRAYGRVGGLEGVTYVLNALDDADPKIRGTALEATTIVPGALATQAIARKMVNAAPPLKIDLLEVLGRRGPDMDDRSMMIMYAAMLDKDDTVRLACIRATETAGITATVPTLLNFVAGPEGPVRDAAEHALTHLQGTSITQDILAYLDRAPAEAKARLLVIVGRRGDLPALSTLMKAASDPDPVVRAGAYKAIGLLRAEGAFDVLLAALEGAPGPDRDAAEEAMMRLPGEAISGELLRVYWDAPIGAKPPLLRVLARREFAGVPELLAAEARHPDETVREAAVRGLVRRGDPASAEGLLEAAKRGPQNVTLPAVDGCLAAAGELEKKEPAAAGRIFVEALQLAANDEQKRSALEGIARTGDPSNEATLAILLPLMKEGNAQAEAAAAVARFAAHLPETRKSEAIDLLQQVIKTTQDPAAWRFAVPRLRELGVDVDPGRSEGFVTHWWLLGPIPRGEEAGWDAASVSLEPVNIASNVKIQEKDYAWKPHHTPDPRGVVNLSAAVTDAGQVVAYAYAEITVDAAQEALFKIASDDGVVVWLNGDRIHGVNSRRSLVVDEDVVKVSLKTGVNRILVKVMQTLGEWEFCLRVATPDGKPVPLRQKGPVVR